MKERYLSSLIQAFCFSNHKMALVSGPRQAGKTTLAKMLLEPRQAGNYYNWDQHEFRKLWTKNPDATLPSESSTTPLVVYDEIHKARGWKKTLKGIYDTLKIPTDILVTGSARLNVYKKRGDSLLGRYFHFRLHPFTLHEMTSSKCGAPEPLMEALFQKSSSEKKEDIKNFEALFQYGGFPEPLFLQDEKRARLWRTSRLEKVIREDLRDLSRIPELSRIEMLASLLPDKVGSPFSVVSVREDLEVSHPTVVRWLNGLKELYYLFEVKPYHRRIVRTLKKEGKIYLWDWTEVDEPAARFENLVACHLLKACHYWTDSGEGSFELYYLRDKEKHEIDFLITRDSQPWLPVEVKLSETEPSPHWKKFLPQLKCKKGVQIVKTPGHFRLHEVSESQVLVVSASYFLSHWI